MHEQRYGILLVKMNIGSGVGLEVISELKSGVKLFLKEMIILASFAKHEEVIYKQTTLSLLLIFLI